MQINAARWQMKSMFGSISYFVVQHNDHLESNVDWLLDQGSKITANHVVTTSGIYPFAKLIGQKPLKKLQLYPA